MSHQINVSNRTELMAALDAATGGETIVLASGDYGDLSLSGKYYDTEVTLVSADPDNQASFSDMSLRWVSNLTFDTITFDHVHEGGNLFSTSHFTMYKSHEITIRNSTFDGDTSQSGAGWGVALEVRSSENITVEETDFFDFYRAAVFYESDGITATGNDISRMSSDGFNFAAVTNALIEGNNFHDFIRPAHSQAHADMIQFWTNGTYTPSENIIIRGNILDIGDGMWTQSIFMRNEAVDSQGAGAEMYYKNVLIEHNHIVNAHLHGISIGATDGLVIRGNSVLHADGGNADGADSAVEIPRIFVNNAATNVTITDNVTSRVAASEDDPTWTVSGNVYVQDQDPDAAGYYRDIFIDSTTFNNDGHAFIASQEGAAFLGGAGTDKLYGPPEATLVPRFDVSKNEDGGRTSYIFDASAMLSGGDTLPNGALFEWDFGGGNIERGLVVSHSFATAGVHNVGLTVHLPNGTQSSSHVDVTIEHDLVVAMALGTGFIVYNEGEGSMRAYDQVSETGLHMQDTGIAAAIWKGHVNDIIGADSFGINISLQADESTNAGELFRIHETIIVDVTGTGGLGIRLYTEGGLVRLGSSGIDVTDLQSHDIRLEYDNGQFNLLVDGEVNNSKAMPHPLAGSGRDLQFGNPWNKQNFSGTITDFSIDNGNDNLPDTTSSTTLDDSFSELLIPTPSIAIHAPLLNEAQDFNFCDALKTTLPEGGKTILLEEKGVSAGVFHEDIHGLSEAKAFGFGFRFTADEYDPGGVLFKKYGSYKAWVKSDGELVFTIDEKDGSRTNIKAAGIDMLNGETRDIVIGFENETLSIQINGEEVARKAFTGEMGSNWHHDLLLGTVWGKDAQAGTLENFGVVFETEEGAWSSMAFGADSEEVGADALAGVGGYVTEWGALNAVAPIFTTAQAPDDPTTQHITDHADEFEWREVVATYSDEGLLIRQKTTYDDGDIVDLTFQDGAVVTMVEHNVSEEEDWQMRTITYVDGDVAQIITEYENYQEITVDYL